MVMAEPYDHELEDTTTIDIFEPGSTIESEVDSGVVVRVIGWTVLGLIAMVGVTIVVFLPLALLGHVMIDPHSGEVYISPVAFVLVSLTEFVLLVPPILYVRKRHLPLASIGMKLWKPAQGVAIGIAVGLVMFGANLLVSAVMYSLPGAPDAGNNTIFSDMGIEEAILGIIVMFVVVGPSEEVLFRGFLQRRLEIYYRRNHTTYTWWAIIVTSFLFAITHLDLYGIPTRFVLGVFLGYLAKKRRYSLLAPSIAHGLNNALVIALAFFGV
ncbi:MAG TPA: CPBP family intramembrane metalloprotease [Candidatus Thorarchaeota archaeon]|nr:MAG: hypothetical protein DRO73_01780 [Candidatus Thorarchaeota archaeon]HDD67806.1 CPBP family intramembrane metalloprotease [Candidatus Thorarchaeota archaeon]